MNRALLLLSLLITFFAASVVPAVANSTFTTNFHGSADGQPAATFYYGGLGPNPGMSFSSNAIELRSMFTGSVNLAPWPTSNPIFNTAISFQNAMTAGMTFSGTVQPVTFSGPTNETRISEAEIRLGRNTTAIPEPSSMCLLGTGVLGALLGRGRRFLGGN